MGWWNRLWNWGRSADALAAPIIARRRGRQGQARSKLVEETLRRCRFEIMEERRMMDADPIKIGGIYIEEDSGSDQHGDTFEIQFEGGHAGSELTRLVIDTDHGPAGRSVGDLIFDTIKGGWGADEAFGLSIVSKNGIDDVTWHVEDGGTRLVFDFKGFHAGDKLVFSIDVDEIQQFDPSETNQSMINEGIDPITSGVEFQSSTLTGTFQELHHHDATGTSEFRNLYDSLFAGSNLLLSPSNPNGLPPDDHLGKRDRSTGSMATVQQVPLPVTISGYVYAEQDLDLVQDAGEQGISGVTLALWKKQGSSYVFTGHTTTTNSSGFYEFGSGLNLTPGIYQVRETQPVQYFSVGAIPGNVSGTASGMAADVNTLTEINIPLGNLHAQRYDFAEAIPSTLTGVVFVDPNENCTYEAGEQPIAGVTVQLLDASGNVLASTQTDAQGRYRFDNLAPGTYAVRELQPPGYLQGGQKAGSKGGNVSVPDLISQIAIGSGETLTDYNFCEVETVSLTGRVWSDTLPNCILDPGESPIGGVTVRLLDAAGNQVATTITNSQGVYSFINLRPGTYTVRESQPGGYFQGGQKAGSHGGDASAEDVISAIVLRSGEDATNYDFCEQPPGLISGFVFRDGPVIQTDDGQAPPNLSQIRDGKLTPDDQRIAGVWLELRHSGTADPVMGSDALAGLYGAGPIRVQTDARGYYEFKGLRQGNYTIIEIHPAGYLDSIDTPGSTSGLAVNPGSVIAPNVLAPFAIAGVNLNNDAILRVPLAVGQQSINNNFSEIQVEAPLIIIPEPPLEEPPLIVEEFFVPPPYLPPPPPPPVPPPPAPPAPGGGTSNYTWHLSVIDAGLPRVASRTTKFVSVGWKKIRFVDLTKWQHDSLKRGTWQVADVDGVTTEVAFGIPGGIPVVGDFNGDGIDEIGIYYQGEWLLDLNGNRRWDGDDLWAQLGSLGDLPIVGDWDGDGKDDIGVYGPEWPGDSRHLAHEPGLPDPQNVVHRRPKNVPPEVEQATEGERLMRLTARGQERSDLIDHVFAFGTGGDVPIAGDWNGDGIRSIGVFRNGRWRFDKDGDGRSSPGDEWAQFGEEGDQPIVGDFNGDGIDEIGIYRAGRWIIDTNGNRRIDDGDQQLDLGDRTHRPVVGDFNGDGVDEPGLYR